MSAARRAYFGALIGALLVLLFHPSARPFLFQGLGSFGASDFLRRSPDVLENRKLLPDPDTPQVGALYLQLAAKRIQEGETLTTDQTLLLVEICQAAADAEPDNAFWRQMESVLQGSLANSQASLAAWKTASLASDFNDYQVSRMLPVLKGLERESGRVMAWHYAVAFARKTPVSSALIANHARRLVAGSSSTEGQTVRQQTILNGRILRDGARSIAAAHNGSDMIDLATGVDPSLNLSPRESVLIRNKFVRTFIQGKDTSRADALADLLAQNDAWGALMPLDAAEQATERMRESIITATIPGGLVLTGLVGFVVYGLGWLLGRYERLRNGLTGLAGPILGVGFGAVVYLLTGLVFPALWMTIAFAGFAFAPESIRDQLPRRLGATFDAAHGILAGVFSCTVLVLAVSQTTASQTVWKSLPQAPAWQPVAQNLVALAATALGVSLVVSQIWSYVNRRPAPLAAGVGLARLGATTGFACLTVGIALTPVFLARDSQVSDTLEHLFRNEPAYYLARTEG